MDATALARYLSPALAGGQPVAVENLLRIPGGASRETWMFDARYGGNVEQLIVRIDPPASLLETDRETEFALYSAFAGSAVPVPRMRLMEPDGSILGGAFFVMDRIGDCESTPRLLLEPAFDGLRAGIAYRMYEILADIHALDWSAHGLAHLAEGITCETSWRHELDHWERVIDENEIEPQPIIRAGIRWLRANPPPPARHLAVVHGDFRVGNFLYRKDGSIVGVLDWEMGHIGDPLEDIAWSCAQAFRWANDYPGGIVSREDVIANYERAAGITVDRDALHWWDVFSDVKGQGIWITGAKSFQEGRSNELFLAMIAYTLVNSQDQYLLRTLGRDA